MSPPGVRAAVAGLAVAFAATGCIGGKGLGSEAEGRDINPAIGRNVALYAAGERPLRPAFAGKDLDGNPVSNRDLLGSVAVVNFWASWCNPCLEEQPVLERTWKKYRDRGVRFLGIDVRDTIPNAKAFVEDLAVTYPSIFDRDQRLAFAFKVLAPPSTFVLDRTGRVAARITGAVTEAGELDVLIDRTLRED